MKGINRFFFNSLLLLIVSCSPRSLDSEHLVQWYENEENGLRVVQEAGPLKLTVQYKTYEYIISKSKMVGDISPEYRQAEHDKNKGVVLFDLHVTCMAGESPLTYKARNKEELDARYFYYHFRQQNDIRLETGEDTLAPLYCLADKGAGLNNSISFSVAFENTGSTNTDLKLVYTDRILGAGIIKAKFKKEDITDIPTLKP